MLVDQAKVNLIDFNFDFQFDGQVIGVDEVGRGSWAGPVMAAAAMINYQKPMDKRLNDSKRLNQKIRREILETLTEICIFGIGEVSNYEIDQIGIQQSTFKAMEMALFNLMEKCNNLAETIILVDGTVKPNFNSTFKSEIKTVKKGDTLSPSIAAASIYAKCVRDDLMIKLDKKYSGYGFSKNMGYGTKYHREKLLSSGPTQFHRMTFSPMKNLKK